MPTHPTTGESPSPPVPSPAMSRAASVVPWLALLGTIALYRVSLTGAEPALIMGPLAIMLIAAWIRARPELRAPGATVAAVVLLGVSAALVLLTLITAPPERAVGTMMSRAVTVLVGWNLILWLPGVGAPPSDGTPWRWLREPATWMVWGAVLAYLATSGVLLYEAAGWHLVLQDEALYTVQAGLLDEPRYGWRMPPEHIPFFRPEYSLYREGVLRTQYSFGYPAVMGLFDAVGLRWWVNPVLGAVTVGGTYWIGARIHSPLAGVIAAVLVGMQEWFVFNVAGAMPHIATGAMLVGAAAMLLRSETAGRIGQPALRAAAGALLGWAVAARPLTGVAIGAGIGVWMIARQRRTMRELLRLGIPVILGMLPLALMTMHYNSVTTGDPLVFGYKAVHGSLHDLGFGMRGFRYFAGSLEGHGVASPFLLPVALDHLYERSWEFARELLPVFTVLPLLWLALARGARPAWLLVAAFLLLPLGHFFHFNSRIRFYVELVPFAAIGLSLLIAHLAATDWRRTAAPLLGVLLLLGAMRLAVVVRSDDAAWSRVVASAEQLEALRERHGRILVFVEEPKPEAYLFRRLWKFNADGDESDILVARSWGGRRNADLAEQFPNHVPLVATWRGVDRSLLIEPLAGTAAETDTSSRGR